MPQSRYGYRVNRFDGGLNTKVAFYVGEPNETPDCLNVDYDDLGAVETRQGLKYVDQINTAPADGFFSYHNDNTSQMVIINDGNLYVSDSGNSFIAGADGTNIFTPGQQVHGHSTQDHLFMSDAQHSYKWDGSAVTRWGVEKPQRLPVPLWYDDATGYAGQVSYVRTHTDVFGTESVGSDVRTVDTSSNIKFVLTAPASIDGVSYVSVYRRRDEEDADYKLLTSIANTGSDATVVDVFDDLTYSTIYQQQSKNTPPYFRCITDHLGYVFGAGPKNPTWLYYSYINEPGRFSDAQVIRVGDGSGYAIRGLAVYSGSLVIATENGAGSGAIWILYTPNADPANWTISALDTPYGSINQESMTKFANYLTYLNRNGIYFLSEQTVGGTTTNTISYNITPDIYALVGGFLERSTAVTFKNKVYFTVPYRSNQNNRCYVYDYVQGRDAVAGQYGAWSRYDWNFSGMVVHDSNLYGVDYEGKVYRAESVVYSDHLSAIDSYFKTMSLYGIDEHKDNMKVWRYAWFTVANVGDWNMTVSWANDFGDLSRTQGSATINLNPQGVEWGSAVWGVDVWDAGEARKKVRINLGGYYSKSIQFKFSTDTAAQHWKVYDMLLEYNIRGIRQ